MPDLLLTLLLTLLPPRLTEAEFVRLYGTPVRELMSSDQTGRPLKTLVFQPAGRDHLHGITFRAGVVMVELLQGNDLTVWDVPQREHLGPARDAGRSEADCQQACWAEIYYQNGFVLNVQRRRQHIRQIQLSYPPLRDV